MNENQNSFQQQNYDPPVSPTQNSSEQVQRAQTRGLSQLFRLPMFKLVAIILCIVLFVLLSYLLAGRVLGKNTVSNSPISSTTFSDEQDQASGDKSTAIQNDSTTQKLTDNDDQSINNNNVAQPDNNVYCGVSGMPEGVCSAITSIRKEGIKGNDYVTADTGSLPDGIGFVIDEKSWSQGMPETGSVNFSAKYLFKTYSGSAYLQNINGTWKVVSYTLN